MPLSLNQHFQQPALLDNRRDDAEGVGDGGQTEIFLQKKPGHDDLPDNADQLRRQRLAQHPNESGSGPLGETLAARRLCRLTRRSSQFFNGYGAVHWPEFKRKPHPRSSP